MEGAYLIDQPVDLPLSGMEAGLTNGFTHQDPGFL